jgi:hypothetical protein
MNMSPVKNRAAGKPIPVSVSTSVKVLDGDDDAMGSVSVFVSLTVGT